MKFKQIILWTAALVIGALIGTFSVKNGWTGVDRFMDFLASAYTSCFKFVAIPTVALAVITALAGLGKEGSGRIFRKTFAYTVFTSFVAALVGLGLFLLISPEALSSDAIKAGAQVGMVQNLGAKPLSVYDHILNSLPSNLIKPFLDGNVLPVVFIAAAFGAALAFLGKDEHAQSLLRCLTGLQKVMFTIIRGLIWALPVGIVAFAEQLARDFGGMAIGSIGKYVAVVLGGNLIQFFVILPLFCFLRGVNGYKVMRQMTPALLMALFTKSSAATLPVTVATAEKNMGARPEVARFILPLCCTINMNGCAAFILTTSLFVMKCGGMLPSLGMMVVWCGIAVLCAIGNAGVPMGCYFLTLSLMAGVGGPLGVLGVILPIYTIIDMIETAENVWSDCCICAVVNKELCSVGK